MQLSVVRSLVPSASDSPEARARDANVGRRTDGQTTGRNATATIPTTIIRTATATDVVAALVFAAATAVDGASAAFCLYLDYVQYPVLPVLDK